MANRSFQGLFSPLEVVSTNNLLKIQQDQCKISMSRLYYSNVFKIYYGSLIALQCLLISMMLMRIPHLVKLVFIFEVLITVLLLSEMVFKGFMQGWGFYFKQVWNLIDGLVVVGSICLLWIGFEMGKGLGEIDDISAGIIIIVRSSVQVCRLIMVIRRKGEQEVQIIDLNGISEADDAPQQTEKNFKPPKKTSNNIEKKKNFEDSVDESR
jgi:hypothetical protein